MKTRHQEPNLLVSVTRRSFLKAAAAAATTLAAPYVITTNALGGDGRPPASERIVMGCIGPGRQGSVDLKNFMGFPEVQVVAVCDVRKAICDRAKSELQKKYGPGVKAYGDFRELLDRPDIDAVHVATPDHWHAVITITACRKGKDVYCQKPESLTIREGRAMVDAARRYNRVVSGGSQRVLQDFRPLAQKCWDGQFGKIKEIFVPCGGPSKRCNLPAAPMDEDIDWEMWLGPAPYAPYHPYRCSGIYAINGKGWRSWSDYSGGGMTDWGAHRFGAAMFFCDKRGEGPVEILPPENARGGVTYVFADGMLMHHGGGMRVEGDNNPVAPRPMPVYRGKSIYCDFLTCVKTRQRSFRDIEFGHRTATVCHLGNICYALGRKLKWDPVKEEFPGDDQANAMRDRARREPWTI